MFFSLSDMSLTSVLWTLVEILDYFQHFLENSWSILILFCHALYHLVLSSFRPHVISQHSFTSFKKSMVKAWDDTKTVLYSQYLLRYDVRTRFHKVISIRVFILKMLDFIPHVVVSYSVSSSYKKQNNNKIKK